jgi:hypothetical protein
MKTSKKGKEIRDVRITIRMTKSEAAKLTEAAKTLDCRPSYLARLAMGVVTQATEECAQPV